ncbi:ferric reductase [Grimontia indica]|uniref:Ferric reductase n=1 Tax=Grimontia indica TaxID=1056512 RepID=R1IT79_9GAMM|nr:cytochrome and DOMON domain-containing protein [Grimontia indica]EOD80687.1 ferric reductase [Grimontia indica]
MKLLLTILMLFSFLSNAEEATQCNTYQNQARLIDSDLTLCWSLDDEAIKIKAFHPGEVWIGLGFGKTMTNADAVIGYIDKALVVDSHMSGRLQVDINDDPEQNITGSSIEFKDNETILVFERMLDTGDSMDVVINPSQFTDLLWAVGGNKSFGLHPEYGVQQIHFESGEQTQRSFSNLIILHALLLVLSWGVLSPIIITVTRYFKVTPGQNFPIALDNKFWWVTHWLGHAGVIVLSIIAFGLSVWSIGGFDLSTLHAKVGIAVLALSVIQGGYGWARGTKGGPVDDDGNPVPRNMWYGDHYNMTLYRRLFEWLHKSMGYVVLIVSHLCLYTGFFLFNLGAWAYILLLVMEVFMVGAYVLFSLQHRWIDTYHAIWGFSRSHPGNRFSKRPYEE